MLPKRRWTGRPTTKKDLAVERTYQRFRVLLGLKPTGHFGFLDARAIPSAHHVFSSITLKPPFSKDFVQDPEKGLGRWVHFHDSVWSIPNAYPKVVTFYYSNVASGVERLMNSDETRDGWRFDYEGIPDDASEAMSILRKNM